jgi:hypothetical protein
MSCGFYIIPDFDYFPFRVYKKGCPDSTYNFFAPEILRVKDIVCFVDICLLI